MGINVSKWSYIKKEFDQMVAVISHLIVGNNVSGLENKSHESEMSTVCKYNIPLLLFENNIECRGKINRQEEKGTVLPVHTTKAFIDHSDTVVLSFI